MLSDSKVTSIASTTTSPKPAPGGQRRQLDRVTQGEDPARCEGRTAGDEPVRHGGHPDAGHPRVVFHPGPCKSPEPSADGEDAMDLPQRSGGLDCEHETHTTRDDVEGCLRVVDGGSVDNSGLDVGEIMSSARRHLDHAGRHVADHDTSGRSGEAGPDRSEAARPRG
jgi:hypothetical protein